VRLDPSSAALYALIAICLVLVGGIITAGQLGVAERGTILVAIGTILAAIGWRTKHRPGGDE